MFWIDADNGQNIQQAFKDIAKMQTPPLHDTSVSAVLQWLAVRKESFLLILDNCDDSTVDFAKYLPSRGGSIIITTRLGECRNLGSSETLDDLGQEASSQLLLNTCGIRKEYQEEQGPHAKIVASLLGHHALALVHAGAYIQKGYCSLLEYCQHFSNTADILMKFKPVQQASRYGSVYTTFEVSADAIASSDDEDGHLALQLLGILAFLDPEGVSEDIFSRAFDFCRELEDHCGKYRHKDFARTHTHARAQILETTWPEFATTNNASLQMARMIARRFTISVSGIVSKCDLLV